MEKSKFTLYSQYKLSSVFRKPFCEALFFVYCPANFRPVDKLLTWRKSGIIEGGEGNATEDAHGNDRRPGTEGTFSPKAGKRIRLVLCV